MPPFLSETTGRDARSARELFRSATENTHWGGDARIIGTVVDKSENVSAWLKEFAGDVHGGVYDGMLVKILRAQCDKLGVQIMCNTGARKILKDGNDWTCGVLADQGGETIKVEAQVTVLATGGFLGDPVLMEKYFPCYDDKFSEEVNTEGFLYSIDGIKMALEAGAGNDGTIAFEWSLNKIPSYKGDLKKSGAISTLTDNRQTPEVLWVNNVGVRFTDESELHSTNAIYRQPNKDCFIILDEGIVEHLTRKHPGLVSPEKLKNEIAPLIEADQALVTDSVGAVAAWIRGKKHILQHAIDEGINHMNQMAITSFKKQVLRGIILFLFVAFAMWAWISIMHDGETVISKVLAADAAVEAPHLEHAGSARIDGTYVISLPMPGAAKESTLVLASRGNSITGTMSAPGDPSQVSPIRDGGYVDGHFRLSADIGRIAFSLEGTCSDGDLKFNMTTMETIPLTDGARLSGKTGEITGTYLVPVYSPGGIRENHFNLVAKNGVITGEMYVPDTGGLSEGVGGPPANMQPPREGGPPDGAPGSPQGTGMNAAGNGKRDLNAFFDGTCEKNNISIYTKTGQGSLFHFTGMVEGDKLKLMMHVTDVSKGIEGKKRDK